MNFDFLTTQRTRPNEKQATGKTTTRQRGKTVTFGRSCCIEAGDLTQSEIKRICAALELKNAPDRERLRAWQFIKDVLCGMETIDRGKALSLVIRSGHRFVGHRNFHTICRALLNP